MFLRNSWIILFGCFVHFAAAQGSQWQADVPVVEKSGMHAIVLAPELVGLSRTDLGDLRLVDSTGQEVPYVIKKAEAGPKRSRFEPYAMVRNEVLPKSTVVEIERPEDQQIEELHIWIRPVDVRKQLRITGSDNGTDWYMVKDDHVVPQGARGDPPHQVLLVDVPRSDYRFLRITLNDSLTAPMRILGVGRFVDQALPARYTEATITWEQRDPAGTTILRVRGAHPIPVERISFSVQDTIPYHRNGWMSALHTVETRNGRRLRKMEQEETMAYFTVASDLDPIITLPGSRETEFELRIDNGDDRPLHFSSLKVYQIERLLLANLEADMRYHFTTGDTDLHAPEYDITHFAAELPQVVDTLSHGEVLELSTTRTAPFLDPAQWWIWVLILVLMAAMGVMAVRMLRKQG